ncbi:MAG: hypothetical protein WCR46_00025 [Deltaproteobacteria bacterium]
MPIIVASQNLRLLSRIARHDWIRDEQQPPHVEGRAGSIAAKYDLASASWITAFDDLEYDIITVSQSQPPLYNLFLGFIYIV